MTDVSVSTNDVDIRLLMNRATCSILGDENHVHKAGGVGRQKVKDVKFKDATNIIINSHMS